MKAGAVRTFAVMDAMIYPKRVREGICYAIFVQSPINLCNHGREMHQGWCPGR